VISVRRAKKLLASFPRKTILVVGDLMLDRYVTGGVTRISPEAPVPVVHVGAERAVPGGAANVAMNLRSLGGRAMVAGVVGCDSDGRELRVLLEKSGIDTSGLLADRRVMTTVKTRIVAERQQVVRVDREGPREQVEGVLPRLCRRLARIIPQVDGVIIEDYGKGVICQTVVDTVAKAARKGGIPVGLDPKDDHALRFSNIALATPNYAEACLAAGLKPRPLDGNLETHATLALAGKILPAKWNCRLLIITLGPHGMYLVSEGRRPLVIPAKAREVFDVCGAGDTVIATAMLGLVAGATHEEAAALANYAAGVVVGKLGTATCAPGELLAYMG